MRIDLLVQALLLQGMQGRWIMRGKVPTDDRLGNRRTYPQKSLRRGFVLAGMSLCDVHAAKFRVHVHATNKAGAQHNHRRWRCRACNEAYTCEHGFIKSNCLQCEAIKSGVQAQVAGGLGAAALAPSAPADEKMKQDQTPPPPPNSEEAGKLELETAADSAQVLVAPVMVDQLSLDHAADGASAELPLGPSPSIAPPEGLSRVCVHKRWRVFCAECGGSGLCPHNKRKGTCKACGGAQFCEHERLRRQCKVCRWCLRAAAARYHETSVLV